MIDTIHLFTQIRKKAAKSSFKPDSEFIENAISEFENRGGVIEKVKFSHDEFNLFKVKLWK